MELSTKLARQWVTIGSVAGIIANLIFPVLLLVSLPSSIEIFFAGMFGVTFSLCGFGFHNFLKQEKTTVISQIAALFVFVSGFLFTLMLVVQQVFHGYLLHFRSEVTSEKDLQLLDWIERTVDPIHLSMQISNDFFCATAMLLFSFVMYSHSSFGKIWSISGSLIAASLLVIKCYAFPFTPREVGIPYIIGPLVALWFLVICLRCLNQKNKVA
ncbi:MAG: hypothetical protein AAFZ89_15760 [Bacteroidota bacterium]